MITTLRNHLASALLGIAAGLAAPTISMTAAEADVNFVDARGNTPLHLAALRGDADAVNALLARRADVNALNKAGATALHYGTGSARIVSALLAHGAKPDVKSAAGVTPLLSAINRENSFDVARRLIDVGAEVNGALTYDGWTNPALAIAIFGGDPRTIRLMVEKGAAVNAKSGNSPLATAAYMGDLEAARLLLDRGAEINYDAGFAGPALNYALYAGHTDVAALLIERGADIRQKSPMGHGTPPMVWSAYTDSGESRIARLLLDRGAEIDAANDAGETALSYALKRGPRNPLVAFLQEAGAKPAPALSRAKETPNHAIPASGRERTALIRTRVQQAIDLLQRNSTAFLENGFVRDRAKCISCHQQTLPAVAFGWARERGLRVDDRETGRLLQAQLDMWLPRVEAAWEMSEPVPDPSVSVGYSADALAALNYRADDMTSAMSHYLLGIQRTRGSWPTFDRRPPMEDGPIVGTAWALRALQVYPPPGREREVAAAVKRAREWLARAPLRTHNDRVFQLLGLAWAGESPAALQSARRALLATQQAGGGWAQLDGLAPDSWATGSALVALHKAGLPVTDAGYQRGIEFLLRTQFADGSWWVRSRTWPFQPHFDGRFPHGKDQWISAGGTAWAAMALLLTLEPDRAAPKPPAAATLIAAFQASKTGSAPAVAVPPNPGSAKTIALNFSRDIYPVLERSCVNCHGSEKPKGGFSLASREALLKGGQSGDPAIVPGRSAESHLLRYISDQIEDLEMPPLNRREKYPALTAAEVAVLRQWIDAGAEWDKPSN